MNNLKTILITGALLTLLSPIAGAWGVIAIGGGTPPESSACSGTKGNSATTDTGFDSLSAGTMFVYRIATGCTGTPATINFRTKYLNGNAKFVIYSDAGTEPGTLLYTSSAYAGGNTSTVVTISDTACDYELTGDSYYIGIVADASGRIYYSSATGGTGFSVNSAGYYTSPPSSWPTGTDDAEVFDFEVWLTF